MATNSNGQAAYLVLDSLSHGSKYGLEIIEYILDKTKGNFVLKKPTLYSCLTRMEKKGLVSSSYWGESELGGKRHYYTITNSGKIYLSELAAEFENATFTDEEESNKDISTMPLEPEKPLFYHQDNLFSLAKDAEKTEKVEKKEEETSNVIENQIDIFSMPEQNTQEEQETRESVSFNEVNEEKHEFIEEKNDEKNDAKFIEEKNDAKFLDESEHLTLDQEEQNKRLYDTSSELKKYRNRKSFSENQIEMSVVYNTAQDEEIQKQRIEALKQSMLKAKENNFNQIVEERHISAQEPAVKDDFKTVKEEVDFPQKDDAIFITEPRIESADIPVQKKITPPNIEISVTNENLPAPKRDSNLEPTYKDMMSKLFERKKEKKMAPAAPIQEVKQEEYLGSFVDYDTLKRYYSGHGIEFKEYKKNSIERIHNTNFLIFISSIFLFLCSGIGCAVFFGIIAGAGLLQSSSNFLFYTIPLLFAVYALFTFICHKVMPSKKASLKYNGVTNWAIFALGSVLILIINVIAGMQYEIFGQFLTSLLLPIFALLLAFPINFYAKKFLFKKYAK